MQGISASVGIILIWIYPSNRGSEPEGFISSLDSMVAFIKRPSPVHDT